VIPKPPYSVMTMDEIRALPWNGFNVVSTFSGCGGSSTGYRMAGFRVLYASEFVEAAQDAYRANMDPATYLDGRDIREVTAGDLLAAAGVGVGEIDLFDGSPPCSAFSTAGKLDGGWGKVKKYSDTKQRVDDLFFEFVRLIKATQPRVFVAENVAGLVRGVAKGYFLLILKALKECGYRVTAKVLNAAWLGVPQVRNRLIFVGVREDLPAVPVHPRPLPYQYIVRDALPYIGAQYDRQFFEGGVLLAADEPSPAITTGPTRGHGAGIVTDNVRLIHDTRGSRPTFSKGNVTDTPIPPLTTQMDHHVLVGDGVNPVDPETGQNLSMAGYAVYEEWKRLRPGQKSQKYFHVRRQHLDQPYDTIMARQGSYVQSFTGPAHWTEPRKLNLVELRALGGFPPDFVLTGTYSQRWERIGRAVPPVVMSKIASTVRDKILTPLRDQGKI
jgi:DNA (cytosine-5)-methyltransferase 1